MADLEQGVAAAGGGLATDTNQEIIISLLDNYKVIISQDSVDPSIDYAGKATPGSATSSAVWQIKKVDNSTDDEIITWADGDDNFDNIWDNRESLSYS